MRHVVTTMQQAASDGVSYKAPAVYYDGTTTEGSSFTSSPVFVGDAFLVSVQFSCTATGSPVGTAKIQVSDDPAGFDPATPDAKPATWIDMSMADKTNANQATQAVNGSTSLIFQDKACTYRWLRFVYTVTSGTCAPTIRVQQKGMQ